MEYVFVYEISRQLLTIESRPSVAEPRGIAYDTKETKQIS